MSEEEMIKRLDRRYGKIRRRSEEAEVKWAKALGRGHVPDLVDDLLKETKASRRGFETAVRALALGFKDGHVVKLEEAEVTNSEWKLYYEIDRPVDFEEEK